VPQAGPALEAYTRHVAEHRASEVNTSSEIDFSND
jgi:hypothetical protein